MGWEVEYTGNTKSFREVSEEDNRDRPREGATLTEKLRYVYPEDDPGYGRKKPSHKSYLLLKELRDHYGTNAIISFQEIRRYTEAKLGCKRWPLAKMLNHLWRMGLLKKLAAGEYGQGWRGKYKGRVGRYHGVHYQIIER